MIKTGLYIGKLPIYFGFDKLDISNIYRVLPATNSIFLFSMFYVNDTALLDLILLIIKGFLMSEMFKIIINPTKESTKKS